MAFDRKAFMKIYNKKDKARPDRKAYHRKIALGKYRARQALIRFLKEITPCTDCNLLYPYHVMDLDHTRGVKKRKVSEYASGGLNSFLEELAKCDIVCANCHKARTHNREQHAS
jgi:hypothetical protein